MARIIGTVSDPTGAIVPGANVTVKNEKTGQERKVSTNEQGLYVATQLPPATYTILVNSSGFAPAEIKNINVQVGQERTVNVSIQAAAVSSAVTVEGGSLAQVDTSSARMGVNVTEREVAELPLNGRQISQLYLLTPGAVNNGAGTFDDIRFNGRANQQNIIRFDGVEGTSIIDASPGNINGEVSSQFRLQSSLESVQEFRVESSNYPAEYGTGTGAQISVVTKSGGNAFHGDIFEYLRNDALDARNFFDSSTKNKLRLNQFGGSIGGPIVKDKTFFFFSSENIKQRIGFPMVETTLSAAARARAVPAIQPLLAAFPIGQGPTQNPDFDVVNVTGRSILDEYAGTARFDHNFNDRYHLFARYQRDQGYFFADQNSTRSAYTVTAVPQNAVVTLNQVLSATTINETKVGLNGVKTRINGLPNIPELNGVALQLNGSVALAGIAGQGGSAGIATPTGLVRANSATNGRGAPYTNDSISFIDNLSIIHGSHNLKFGVEVRPIELYTDRQGGTTYTFNNVSDFLANKPASIQFLGDVSAMSPFTGKAGLLHLRNTYYIGYAQDEWKVNPQLTINYGLRYEYFGVLHETNNKAVYFNVRTGQLEPGSRDWYNASKLNFAPRLGVTYAPARLNGKTVFRIGAGYFYGPGQTEDTLQPAESDRVSTTISGSDPRLAYPLNLPALVSSYDINSPTLGFQPRAYSPDYYIPEKILQYSASIQQQLPSNTVLTVAYVGSQGRNLFLRSISNRIIGVGQNLTTGAASPVREFGSRFAEVDYKTSHGSDHYDSLQTTVNRRFTNGLTLGSQWTWAHSIGNTSGSNEARTSANNFSFAGERGNSNFDVRHSFNLSALYQLPYGKGRQFGNDSNGFAQALLGGWQVGGIVNARTGLPIDVLITRPDIVYVDKRTGTVYGSNPVSAYDPNIVPVINVPGGGASRNIRRPDVVPGVNPYLDANRQFLNPAAFAEPAPGTYGNLGRNALHGPNLEQLDLTFDKKFPVTERSNLEFRAEVYNILNHANFAVPGGGTPRLADPLPTSAAQVGAANKLQPGQPFSTATQGGTFGQLTSTVSNSIGLGTNRQIQLSLRFNF